MKDPAAATVRQRIFHAGLFLVLLSVPSTSQAQAILDNELVEPRTFGYAVGDKIRREVRLSLRSDYRLDAGSLPKPGRLDRWLEFAPPEIREQGTSDGHKYHLILTYQLLNAPVAPEKVTIPQQDLRIVGETHALTTLVPALRIDVAPLTSGIRADSLSGASLQQDREPAPLLLQARQARLAWTGAALLALLLFDLWRRGLMAFIARRNLPFATAMRDLKRLRAEQHTAAMKVVHEAINRTAGRAVFAHNLDDFLAAHPAFAGLRDPFRQLFTASARVFFDDGAEAPPAGDISSLLHLCRLCRSIERQYAEGRLPGRLHAGN